MAKFYGPIGYAESYEAKPGDWRERITPRTYSGDLVQNTRLLQPTDQVNDNINVANKISIVADAFANQNFHSMRWIEFMGAKWKIKKVEVMHPRLILTMGDVYNGK